MKKVMMIHQGRVGSTALVKSLNHPQIYVAGEIFTRTVAINPNWRDEMNLYDYFDYNIEVAKKSIPKHKFLSKSHGDLHYLFEYKPCSCQPSPRLFLDAFRKRGVEKFVFLYRENLIRRYVSFLISKRSGVWHQTSETPGLVQVRIPYNDCTDPEIGMVLGNFKMLLDYYYGYLIPYFKECLQKYGKDVLVLTYEKDIEFDVRAGNRKLVEFLGVDESIPVSIPTIKRQNPFPLSEIILNYDEIYEKLKDTPYCDLLSG